MQLLQPVAPQGEGPHPLLVYIPSLDGTGQGIRRQIPAIVKAGYDLRCVHIPASDRSSWPQLVAAVQPLVQRAAEGAAGLPVTVLADSFFAPLALRLALAAPELVSRLVLVNPATHFTEDAPAVSAVADAAAALGLLEAVPTPIYQAGQDLVAALLVETARVSASAATAEELRGHSFPVDLPSGAAAHRMKMLRSSSLPERYLQAVQQPTLVVVSGRDRLLPSLQEGARLTRLLPAAERVVFGDSGHTLLLEDDFDITEVMDCHGFPSPVSGRKAAAPRPRPLPGGVSDADLEQLGRLLEPWRALTAPDISGLSNLPSPVDTVGRPILFVGNHSGFGALDLPLLVYELYLRGFAVRSMAHPAHWLGPMGQVFERFGGVKATPFTAYRLLKAGEHLLLFPGGGDEVVARESAASTGGNGNGSGKKDARPFRLNWEEHADFVRMAARFKAVIVPFATLGADDAPHGAARPGQPSREELLASPLGPLVQAVLGDDADMAAIPSLGVPALPGMPVDPASSMQRVYFRFGEPIDTGAFAGSEDPAALYSAVREAVEEGLASLDERRRADPERSLISRMFSAAMRLVPRFTRIAEALGAAEGPAAEAARAAAGTSGAGEGVPNAAAAAAAGGEKQAAAPSESGAAQQQQPTAR